ncbi:hypothetical protein PNEG_02290 [Pneumocystis murina B123]|uniref:Uncharacterized protein n=1 Tax=Pneumocystis murina (strain B123) TaxID=1069680 RepID=M7P658_PNEMU|nr:hypothetical protein PNEG_02290 [Pneumocystis murina B123]EMR09335.1 hypothetical protein PNEG_02290 [Pneumocystis murina B123]
MSVSEKTAKSEGENSTFECLETEEIILEKKRKKKEKRRLYRSKKRAIEEPYMPETVSFLSAAIQADYVEKKIREVYMNYSSLELEDMRMSEKYFFETCWTGGWNLEHLSKFLEIGIGYDPRYIPSPCGSPHTIILAMAALRVADITRSLRSYKTKDGDVAKLFAKHIKLKDHINYLSRTRLTIAVGTPGRILDLINCDSLKVDFLNWIILDTTYNDVKKRKFWDMPECWRAMIKLITTDPLKTMLKKGSVKIVYY